LYFEGIDVTVSECPYCSEIVEMEPPDRSHTAFSSKKLMQNVFYGETVKKKVKCENPNCKKYFEAFWYSPLEYFLRV
jgi:hypothetical protein